MFRGNFEVVLRCDYNDKMLQLAQQLHQSPVCVGDVCTDALIAPICSTEKPAGTIASGVACQPYSKLGDMRQEHDKRALTLPGVLRLAFLCRIGAVILECVSEEGFVHGSNPSCMPSVSSQVTVCPRVSTTCISCGPPAEAAGGASSRIRQLAECLGFRCQFQQPCHW